MAKTKKKTAKSRQTGRKGRLNNMHRECVVKLIAQYEPLQDIADMLKEVFNIEVTLQALEYYDPTKVAGRGLTDKWKTLFEEERAAFLKNEKKAIPLANRAVRLKKLQKAALAYERNGNYIGMANMLERIAKEVGGSFTNRREVTGKNRGPIEYREVDAMTDDEIDAELRGYGIDPEVHDVHPTTQ